MHYKKGLISNPRPVQNTRNIDQVAGWGLQLASYTPDDATLVPPRTRVIELTMITDQITFRLQGRPHRGGLGGRIAELR